MEDLQAGDDIGLISDAGTPCVSDPGANLVDKCMAENLPYTAIPGPSSLSMAMCMAGSAAERMQFVGFLPKKSKKLIGILGEALAYPGATFFFESPHRVLKTLEIIRSLEEDRQMMVFREMTKMYEEVISATAGELFLKFTKKPPKGEFIMMIKQGEIARSFDHLTLQDHVSQLEDELGFSRKEAIKAVAELRELPKRTVYNTIHEIDHVK
jgi:16S rRNA (cytidine1402-2'-O)-methyltransferase